MRLDASTGDGSSVTRYARMIARRVDKVFAPVLDDAVEMVWMQFYQFTLDSIDYTDLAQRVNKMVNGNRPTGAEIENTITTSCFPFVL